MNRDEFNSRGAMWITMVKYVIRHFEKERTYRLEEVRAGQQIDLGDLHADIVALPGHTQRFYRTGKVFDIE